MLSVVVGKRIAGERRVAADRRPARGWAAGCRSGDQRRVPRLRRGAPGGVRRGGRPAPDGAAGPAGRAADGRRPRGCATPRSTRPGRRGGWSGSRAATVFGEPPAAPPASTSYLERQNATDRHRNARKGRKTYRFSKDWDIHAAITAFTMYSYNFCWPVRTLRVKDQAGRWQQRTPAMAAELIRSRLDPGRVAHPTRRSTVVRHHPFIPRVVNYTNVHWSDLRALDPPAWAVRCLGRVQAVQARAQPRHACLDTVFPVISGFFVVMSKVV